MIVIMSGQFFDLFTTDDARRVLLGADETLFRSGDPVARMFMVEQGDVALIRHTEAGASVRLQQAGPGVVLAEASAYSHTYHCDAVAKGAAHLLSLAKPRFLDALAQDPDLAASWAAHLAHQVQVARMRAEIRTLPTVARRLDVWLGEGNTMPRKGEWQGLASDLGVTREALYRELALRRR